MDFPVTWHNGRKRRLDSALWGILRALSQGRAVVVHCQQSFHRGPVGLMAIPRRLFDLPVDRTKQLILERRIPEWNGVLTALKRDGGGKSR